MTKVFSVDEIKAIVKTRTDQGETLAISFEAESATERIDLKLFFQYWPQYRTYIALPVVVHEDGDYCLVSIRLPEEWRRYMKHELRKTFGVRHLHNVNRRDNAKRIEHLLGVQYVQA